MINKKVFKWLYFSLIVLLLISLASYIGYSQDIPTYTYEKSVLINFDYTFNNEALNKPIQVRENPKTKGIVVLDNGNNCLYIFTQEGKFVKKTGQAGQGPGDLLKPAYFTIDNNGNMYIYEDGNARISIFDYNGKYINSFRIDKIVQKSFSVTPEGEILISHPHKGHYITVYSKEGKLLKNIGKVDETIKFNPKDSFTAASYAGFPIMLSNGNYCIFLETLYYIKIFKEQDILLKDITYDKVFPEKTSYKKYKEKLTETEQRVKSKSKSAVIMMFNLMDIIYKNNKIYYAESQSIESNKSGYYNINIFILNNNLEIEEIITLRDAGSIDYNANISYKFGFDVLSLNKVILYPDYLDAEIFRYIIKGN